MTDANGGGAGPSVAIVAMGQSNQAWLKRCYNGDNYEYYTSFIKRGFDSIFPDERKMNENLIQMMGNFPLDDAQKEHIKAIGSSMTPNPEERERINDFVRHLGIAATKSEIGEPFDEVWGINHMGKILKNLDMIVCMDDLRREQPRYTDMLLRDIPILTSTAYPEFPTSISYPVSEVVQDIGWMYFTNSVVYAVAYAIHKKFKRISLYGCDFHYPGIDRSEEARANCEFMLGIAHARGITIEVCPGSTTMDMNKKTIFYGYDKQPDVVLPDRTMKFDGRQWVAIANDRVIASGEQPKI